MEEENPGKFLVFEIIACDPGSINFHILEQNTCQWQSICYQATLRFKISLRKKFSRSISLRVMKKMMKVLSCTFYKSLGHFNMLTVKECSETVFFREWSKQVFDSL